MNIRHATLGLLVLGPLVLLGNWPQWRGPNRDGISPETGLLKTWPAAGPPLVWKTQGLGEGYSAFSVVQGRLYTQGQRGSDQFVMAFDTTNGKKVWETKSGRAFNERRGPGPRGTPAVDGERLYAQAADGTLVCLKNATGEKVWEVDLLGISGGSVPQWGISGSPLVDGNRLIVAPGGSNGSILALDKMTGKVLWKSQSDSSGYSSPIVYDHAGKRQIATLTGDAAVGLQASDGKLQWRYEKVANGTANIATPIHHDGHLFVSTDYGTGCALLRLTLKGAEEVYFNRDMKNHYSSSVLVHGYLYGFSSTILTAMKWEDGTVAWRDRSVGKGSVAYADGRLYVHGENGNIALVEATPTAYKEISRFSIPQGRFPTWTPPVISNGRLYLREQDQLYCFNISASSR
jgi:outer membrane protein assembly factor BamB